MRYYWPKAALLSSAVFFMASCGRVLDPEPTGLEVLPRESKIPADATRVTPEADDHPPVLHFEGWEDPVPMPGPVNTAGAEDSPFVTPDGQEFYFFFTPDVRIPAEGQLDDGVTGIYRSKRMAGTWSEPQRIILNDDVSLDGCQFIREDTMWFCSVRTGGFREIDFYTAKRIDGQWTEWRNAGERLNVEIGIGEMHLSADGSSLYFHADKPEGKGGLDIWLSRFVEGEWQDPQPVTPVNSFADEGWPFLTQDGRGLWFTRTWEGTPAIFRSINNGVDWQEPELIVSSFAGEPSLDIAENLYFTHHFYRNGEMIEADIYVAYRNR